MERRSTAILAADVVGYSRRMKADEAGTLAVLDALRAELFDPLVARHRGRIVRPMGDGTLVEFASAVDAVDCAVGVQRALAARNADTAADRRIELRIGIGLGDVTADGAGLAGDGVTIASGLERLASHGGICVPARVFEQSRGRVDARFEDLGLETLENVAEPVHVYRWVPGAAASVAPAPVEEPQGRSLVLATAVAILIAVSLATAWWAWERIGNRADGQSVTSNP